MIPSQPGRIQVADALSLVFVTLLETRLEDVMKALCSAVAVLALVQSAAAVLPFIPVPPPLAADHDDTVVKRQAASFTQYISHDKPELGTFTQRYWWNATFWKGPGSPVGCFCSLRCEQYQRLTVKGRRLHARGACRRWLHGVLVGASVDWRHRQGDRGCGRNG